MISKMSKHKILRNNIVYYLKYLSITVSCSNIMIKFEYLTTKFEVFVKNVYFPQSSTRRYLFSL